MGACSLWAPTSGGCVRAGARRSVQAKRARDGVPVDMAWPPAGALGGWHRVGFESARRRRVYGRGAVG